MTSSSPPTRSLSPAASWRYLKTYAMLGGSRVGRSWYGPSTTKLNGPPYRPTKVGMTSLWSPGNPALVRPPPTPPPHTPSPTEPDA